MITPLRQRGLPALIVLLALLAGCTLGVSENEPGGGAINITTVPLIAVGDRAPGPGVCGETLDDDDLCLEALSGSPTLVNFWASWCGPCAREVPELIDIATEYDGRAHLVGVNAQDSRTNARSFERDQGVNYPSLFDDDSSIAAAFGGIAPEALPSTILLDAESRVAVRIFGAVSAATLRPYLDALLLEAS
ncbi:TlpA disulfide reductase family protein [soil metagenome]